MGIIKLNTRDVFELKTHLLISGCTGSGKSVTMRKCINSLIAESCNNLFYMIDLKRVELSQYKELPQLQALALDFESAIDVLETCNKLMYDRYKLLEIHNATNCKDLNLKEVYICIDEIAELTSVLEVKQKKKAISLLSSLARLGRASGLHLIIATQYPTKSVLPMQLLMNVDYRICMRTATPQGSCVVLNYYGAEKLTKKGEYILHTPDKFEDVHGLCYYDSPQKTEYLTLYRKAQYLKLI